MNYNSNIFEINNNKLSIKGLNQDTFSGKISNISNINGINIINSNISNLLANDILNVKIINISNSLSLLNLSNANNDTMLRMTDSTTGFSSNNGLIIGKNANNNCVFWNYYNSDIIFRTTENNLFYSIFQKKIPWGMYFAEDYDASVNLLYNYIKNNNKNAICTGTINKLWGNGNGANSNINYISGSISSTVDFGTSSLPANFTICSLTRYNGATKNRIITGNNINFCMDIVVVIKVYVIIKIIGKIFL